MTVTFVGSSATTDLYQRATASAAAAAALACLLVSVCAGFIRSHYRRCRDTLDSMSVRLSVSQSVSMLFYWHIDGNSLTLNCRMLLRLATLVYFFDKLHHCDNCFIKKNVMRT